MTIYIFIYIQDGAGLVGDVIGAQVRTLFVEFGGVNTPERRPGSWTHVVVPLVVVRGPDPDKLVPIFSIIVHLNKRIGLECHVQ